MAKAAKAKQVFYSTGRRKTSVARIRLIQGKGEIIINKKPYKDYFGNDTLSIIICQPFHETNTLEKYHIFASVKGGGSSGQAGAVRHGISRALVKADEGLKDTLKKAGFLTRDPRKKERKKYGQKGARKQFQFTKR
ncbi:MAG: 30S ribosomal protein S9 [bacterium]